MNIILRRCVQTIYVLICQCTLQSKRMRLLPTLEPRVGRVGVESEGVCENCVLGHREVRRSAEHPGRDPWHAHDQAAETKANG